MSSSVRDLFDNFFSSFKPADDYLMVDSRHIFKKPVFEKIGKNRFAFGLEWYCQSFVTPYSVRFSAKSSSSNSAVVVGGKLPQDVSLIGVPAKEEKSVNAYSGAAIVARKFDTAIVICKLPSGLWWLSAAVKNQPIEDLDVVESFEIVLNRAMELVFDYPDFDVYASAEVLEKFEGVCKGKLIEERSLGDLLAVDNFEQSAIKVVSGKTQKIMVSVSVVVFAVFLVAFFREPILELISSPFSSFEEEKNREAWINQNANEKRAVVDDYNKYAATKPLNNWITKMGLTLDGLPARAGGWTLTKMECGAGNPNCSITWSNPKGVGTYESLRSRVEGLGHLNLVKLDMVKQTIAIRNHNLESFEERTVKESIEQLPSKEEFYYRHVSAMQAINVIEGVKFEFGKSKESSFVNAPPPSLGITGDDWSYPKFQYGIWSLSGKSVPVLLGSMGLLDSEVFFGNKLDLTFDHNSTTKNISVSWEVEGYYMSKAGL